MVDMEKKDKMDREAVRGINKRYEDDIIEDEMGDYTLYGEIMSSVFGWISSEKQKERVEYMNEISEELTREVSKKRENKKRDS